jgi:hypothetical protein
MDFDNSLAKLSLDNGGKIYPLIIHSENTNGLGLMNPSIFLDKEKILVNLRSVNYTFYHSEEKIFQHPYGPLTYIHPENDIHLRTENYYLELNENFEIEKYLKINTSKFDTYDPQWEFVGLEDIRLFKWKEKLYAAGVRRDLDSIGTGRMELSELVVSEDEVFEFSRFRIPTPNNKQSYCEKNWMPVLDMPFHFIKWTNPTELVCVDIENKNCNSIFIGKQKETPADLRGGSQVIKWRSYFLAVTHEVDLFKNENGRKDAVYRHRFVLWDKNWNLIRWTRDFSIMSGHVEFCTGLALKDREFLLSFGFQDNAAFILKFPEKIVEELINE